MIGVPDFGDNYLAKLDGLKEIDEDIVSTEYLLQDNDTGKSYQMRLVGMALGAALTCFVFYRNHKNRTYKGPHYFATQSE